MNGLKGKRKEAGLTQIALSKLSNVSLATVRRIEAGKNANISVLTKISKVLGCPVDDLIGDEERKEGKGA